MYIITILSLTLASRPYRNPSGFTQHVLGNNSLLNLGGPLIDAKQSHISVKSFNSVVFKLSGATKNLHGTISHTTDHLCGKQFTTGGQYGYIFTRVSSSSAIAITFYHYAGNKNYNGAPYPIPTYPGAGKVEIIGNSTGMRQTPIARARWPYSTGKIPF